MGSGRHLSRLLASGELGLLCKSKLSPCVCTASFLCLPAFLSGGSLFPAPAHSSHLLGSFFFFFKASLDYNLFLNSLRQTLCWPVTAFVASLHNLPYLCSQHSTRDSQSTESGMGQGSVSLLNEWLDLFICIANAYTCAQSLQSYQNLCEPTDCSLPGSSVHGILQARKLEWIAMPSSKGSSRSRYRTHVSCISCIAGGLFAYWVTWKVLVSLLWYLKHFNLFKSNLGGPQWPVWGEVISGRKLVWE